MNLYCQEKLKGKQNPAPEEIERMFSSIAHKYDFLNHLLSLNFDRKWRRTVFKLVNSPEILTVLDLCTGTGDLAIVLRAMGHRVFGVDLSEKMLRLAGKKAEKRKITDNFFLIKGNALSLPFKDGVFDLITIGFGLRNFSSYETGISEIVRVLKRGGKLIILEFSMPENRIFSLLYSVYLGKILPFIGGIVSGSKGAYEYLSSSIRGFMKKDEVIRLLERAGIRVMDSRALTGGIAIVYTGIKQGFGVRMPYINS